MPEVTNFTPYPNLRFYSADNQDRRFGSIVVKGTFEVSPSGQLLLAEEQAPLVFTDLCHGEVNLSSLWHPSDLVPFKPATDILVSAVARTLNQSPLSSWKCGLIIENDSEVILEKFLRVTGPRLWKPIWKRELNEAKRPDWRRYRKQFVKWELTEASPISELPLHYEYAYGGELQKGADSNGDPVYDTDHRNPLGRGKIDHEWTDHCLPVAAPQIESIDDPVLEPYESYQPQSLGPIPPAWLPRRSFGGTYDQNWKDSVWPAWPADYDFRYHNSAHPDLILDQYLEGSEKIKLFGLSDFSENFVIKLPSERLFSVFLTQDDHFAEGEMKLDTVFLDISPKFLKDWRVYLSWRVNFQIGLFNRVRLYRNVAEIAQALDRKEVEGV